MDSSASGKVPSSILSKHYNDIKLRRALLHGVIFLMNGFAKLVQIQRDIIQTHSLQI